MKKSKLIVPLVLILGCLLIYSSSFAYSVSEVEYNVFDTGEDIGLWDVYQYDYTVTNLSTSTDPISVFGVTFDLFLAFFTSSTPPLNVDAPDGWGFSGIPVSTDITLELFFTPLPSAVIQPGDSLSGFSIRFLTPAPEALGYQSFLTIDTAGIPFAGTTSDGTSAPIPEPGTMILLGISITSFWAYSKKRMKN